MPMLVLKNNALCNFPAVEKACVEHADAENSLPFILALMCFVALFRMLKRDKRSELFSGQFVSRVFTHAKEKERKRSVRDQLV